MKVTLTEAEIEALYATAGNIDPCMFDDMDDKEGERMSAAWTSGLQKLSNAIETLNARKIVARAARKSRGA